MPWDALDGKLGVVRLPAGLCGVCRRVTGKRPGRLAAVENAQADMTVHQVTGLRRLVAVVAAGVLQLWNATLRVEIADAERAVLAADGVPATVLLLWHNQLFMVPSLRRVRRGRRIAALVSASRDGALLAAVLEGMGIDAVRGSSSRLARGALLALIRELRRGSDVAVTPDGPRGPVYRIEGGALVAARRAGARIVCVATEFTRAWRVNSWDGFFLPKPFSRVRLRAVLWAAAEGDDDAGAAAGLAKVFRALAEPNEARFPAPPRARASLGGEAPSASAAVTRTTV